MPADRIRAYPAEGRPSFHDLGPDGLLTFVATHDVDRIAFYKGPVDGEVCVGKISLTDKAVTAGAGATIEVDGSDEAALTVTVR